MTMLSRAAVSKPGSLTVRMKVAAGNAVNRYTPAEEVVVECSTPVFTCLRTTVALGTAAPVGSNTVPSNPLLNCAHNAELAEEASTSSTILQSPARIFETLIEATSILRKPCGEERPFRVKRALVE